MNPELVDKRDRKLARRNFLRNSSIAAGSILGLAAATPMLSVAQQEGSAPRPGRQARQDKQRSSGPSLSRQLARWVVALKYEDLPPAVVDRAKGVTLQNLSSILQGAQMPAGKEAVKLVTDEESGV